MAYSENIEQRGAVAQLGERCVRNAEVEGSTPFRSIRLAVARTWQAMPWASAASYMVESIGLNSP